MPALKQRALIGSVVLLATIVTSVACVRPRPPGGRPTTTTSTPSGPTTTIEGGGGEPSAPGRFITANLEIEQLANGEVFRTAHEAPGVGTVAAKDLRLNIWAPRNDAMTRRPVLMWQFGGGFVVGDRNQMNSMAQAAARKGYVGVTIDYRLSPSQSQAGTRAAYEDGQAAVRWLQARADRFKLNPRAIITGGASAGGINSVDMVTMPATPADILVAGVVSLSGNNWGPAPKAGGPPVIIIAGQNDFLVPLDRGSPVGWSTQGTRTFCNAYKAVGNVCELVIFPGGHMAGVAEAPNRYLPFLMDKVLRPLGY